MLPAQHYEAGFGDGRPPPPGEIDKKIARLGGSTCALRFVPANIQAEKSFKPPAELVVELERKLVSLKAELSFYESLVEEAYAPLVDGSHLRSQDRGDLILETETERDLDGSSIADIYRLIGYRTERIETLKSCVNDIVIPLLPTLEHHCQGLASAFERFSKALDREKTRTEVDPRMVCQDMDEIVIGLDRKQSRSNKK